MPLERRRFGQTAPPPPPPPPEPEADLPPIPLGISADSWAEINDPESDYGGPRYITEPMGSSGFDNVVPTYSPLYDATDLDSIIGRMSPEATREIQHRLIAGGWLSESASVEFGYWGDASRNALKEVMSAANRAGRSWYGLLTAQATINMRQQQRAGGRGGGRGGGGGGGGGRAPFTPQKPNPDDLRRVYRSVLSRMTGREIDPMKSEDAEKLFIDSYTNAVVGAQRTAYEGKEVTEPPSAETAAETQITGDGSTATEAEAFSITRFTDVLRQMMGA